MVKVICAELPRRTSVDELHEMILEQFGIPGMDRSRVGRGCTVQLLGCGLVGQDARIGCGSVAMHGQVAGRPRRIVHRP